MGGSQAGAPADDDHVPLVTSPQHGHRGRRDWQVTTREALRWAGPCPATGLGGGPSPAREADGRGRGEAEGVRGGAEKIPLNSPTEFLPTVLESVET